MPIVLAAIASGELATVDERAAFPAESAGLGDLLSVREVAVLACVHRRTVNKAITSGALCAERGEDGAWRIQRENAVVFAAARRKIGAHCIPPDELDRWTRGRATLRAAARRTLRCGLCGRRFERYRSAYASGRSFCSRECYWAARREPLLARAGACGSPTCTDQDCGIAAGRCHRQGCDLPAFLATYTRRDIRWVRGRATLYCSRSCAVRARNAGVPWGDAYARLKDSEGLVDAREASAIVDRAPAIVMYHARRLSVGQRVSGLGRDGAWLFTRADVARIQRVIGNSPTSPVHRDPERRAGWYARRFNSTRFYGKLAAEIAAQRGKRSGRPPLPSATAERILTLHGRGMSQRQIARIVRVSRDEVRGALRAPGKVGENPSQQGKPGFTG